MTARAPEERSTRPGRLRARVAVGALVALNLYLVSPVFFYDLRLHEGGPDRTFFFMLPASLLGLLTVHLAARRPLFAHLLLAPLYVTTAVDLYLEATYGMRLGSSTLLVLVQNAGGAFEYVEAHRARVLLTVALLLTFYGAGLVTIQGLRWERSRWWAAASGALFVLMQAFIFQRFGRDPILYFDEDRGSPFGVFSQAYVALSVERDLEKRAAAARTFSFHATRTETPAEPETYVLVIGESARPDHWGLYGYMRPTTPRLSAEANLVAFRDVVSQASITRDAVPFILTRGSIVDPSPTRNERGVVSVFRELGFETTWLSTQQRDYLTGLINRFASEAEQARFYEHRYDGALLPDLAAACESTSGTRKRFVVLHTLGSHYHYPSRHPPEFAAYPEGKLSSREEIVNAYDDTVLYTDYVLAEAIRELGAHGGLAALLYVADHGENLRDDRRELFGHMMNNEYDLPVPMLLWFSPSYARKYPARVEAARANADKRLTTRSVFPTLVALASGVVEGDSAGDLRGGAGGNAPQNAAQTLNVLSANVAEVPRWVTGNSEPFDFDARYRRGSSARR